MYGPKCLDLFDLLGPFFGGPLQNHGHKMAAGTTAFCDTLTSVIPAGVRVMERYIREFQSVFL